MRRSCPNCGYHWAWKLGDGRFKCRRCMKRYTFRSIWDSCRLPERTKCLLLEHFARGVPANQVQAEGLASAPAIERFYRTIRQVLSVHEGCTELFTGAVRCVQEPGSGHSQVVVVGITQAAGKLRIFPPTTDEAASLNLDSCGALVAAKDKSATFYAGLPVCGGVVAGLKGNLPDRAPEPGTESVDELWLLTRWWLWHYRHVPVKYLQLYLGETLFRFHHSPQALHCLLYRSLHEGS
jgi:hypothetical protein